MTITAERARSPMGRWALPAAAGCALVAVLLTAILEPAITGVAILALMGAWALMRQPGVLFAGYLLIPYYKGAIKDYAPVDLTVLLAVLVTTQIIPVIRDKRPRSISRAGLVLLASFGTMTFAGVLYAPDQEMALRDALTFNLLVTVPIAIGAVRVGSEPRHVRGFLAAYLVLGLLVLLFGLPQLGAPERLVVLGQNTIQTSRSALLVPIVAYFLVRSSDSTLLRILAAAASIAALMIAFAAGSRGPVLILVVLGVLGVARYLSHPRSANWRAIGAGIGILVATWVVISFAADELPTASTERFQVLGRFVQEVLSGDLSTFSSGDTSSEARVGLFGAAVSLFEERPILGSGTSAFQALNPVILGPSARDEYPHNALLQLAANHGLVGVALFVVMIVLALTRPLPSRPDLALVRFLFLFFLLNAMVSGNVFDDRNMFGLLMLILMIDVRRFQPVPGFGESEPEPDPPVWLDPGAADPRGWGWVPPWPLPPRWYEVPPGHEDAPMPRAPRWYEVPAGHEDAPMPRAPRWYEVPPGHEDAPMPRAAPRWYEIPPGREDAPWPGGDSRPAHGPSSGYGPPRS